MTELSKSAPVAKPETSAAQRPAREARGLLNQAVSSPHAATPAHPTSAAGMTDPNPIPQRDSRVANDTLAAVSAAGDALSAVLAEDLTEADLAELFAVVASGLIDVYRIVADPEAER